MSEEINLLDLPDLVLHNICSYISSPFDLLNLGCTCRKLREITSAENLWWKISVDWLHGMWNWPGSLATSTNTREWFLEFLHQVTIGSFRRLTHCDFKGGEQWTRIESPTFRCYLRMLQLSYQISHSQECKYPFRRSWSYDIGLFSRSNPTIDFQDQETIMSEDICSQLRHLACIQRRDSSKKRARIEFSNSTETIEPSLDSWMHWILPLLTSNTKNPGFMYELGRLLNFKTSELIDLIMHVTILLEKHLIPPVKKSDETTAELSRKVCAGVRTFTSLLISTIHDYSRTPGPNRNSTFGKIIKDTFKDIAGHYQKCLDEIELKVKSADFLQELYDLVFGSSSDKSRCELEGIRLRWFSSMYLEIERVLYGDKCKGQKVAFITLPPQHFSDRYISFCVVSEKGVFVLWKKNSFI